MEFFIGNDMHEVKEIVTLMLENKRHTFAVVSDDFPLPEHDIIGNRFLHSYDFNLTNRYSELDGKIYLL